MTRIVWVAIAVALLVVLLAGCGRIDTNNYHGRPGGPGGHIKCAGARC
jgi:hypothetical protein